MAAARGLARNTGQVATVPAPVGGINAYNSLAAMPETDAVTMLNWLPQPYGCIVRRGCQKWVTGLPATVETLMTWAGSGGTTKLLAASAGSIYDVSSSGIAGAAIQTGYTVNIFNWVGFGNIAGSWLIAVNGVDDALLYGPTSGTISHLTLGDGIVVNTWKNLDPKDASVVTVHQGRIWAVEKNTTFGWYLPTDVIYGVMASYDFGPFFPNGGALDVLTTWTIDSGGGATDLLVAISTKGDVVVYEGIDVTDPGLWKLKGVFYIGSPIQGHRYYTKVAGDLFILTSTGVVSLSTVFLSSQVSVSSDTVYSKKIQKLLSDAAEDLGDVEGWQLSYYPGINQLHVNIPTVTSEGASQLVANTITTAWTIFQGYRASCWAQFMDLPFFGDASGNVLQAWAGYKDYVEIAGTGGTTIRTIVQQAYSYMQAPAVQKQVGMYRPNFLVSSDIVYSSAITYDFAIADIVEPSGGAITSGSLWGIALWGIGLWFGGLHTQKQWTQAQGIGVATSLNMKTSSEADITWVSTDYSYKVGGIL